MGTSVCPGRMRRKAVFSLALLMMLTALKAQDLPSPVIAPSSSASDTGEPVLPTPDTNPQGSDTDLLPKSGELPEVPAKPDRENRSSAEANSKRDSADDGRFEEVRLRAMDSPRAEYLLKRARSSSHASSRRAYLREYYAVLASRMRRLDPDLNSSINAYEEAKIHEIGGAGRSTPEGSTHRARARHLASHESHRRSHRVTSRYHERRMNVTDYPFGPQYSPYGYGPPPQPYPYPW